MKKARLAADARAQLDARFREFGPGKRYAPPVRGWIKAIRDALGMSMEQLAERLKIKQPSLATLEKSEAKGTIELATLRRVAEALDCTLVYALVPNKPLETDQAEGQAAEESASGCSRSRACRTKASAFYSRATRSRRREDAAAMGG